MQIQVNTDHHIDGHARFQKHAEAVIGAALARFADRVTRVEVHLSDENGTGKGGKDDHRCLLEVRMANLQPVTASHSAANSEDALEGALDKLERVIDGTLGRIFDPKGGASFGDLPA